MPIYEFKCEECNNEFESIIYDTDVKYTLCPKCNEIFTIKKLKSNEDSSFVTTCPCCGAIGRIPAISKSSEIKFECTNCGEQVSIWAGETKPSNDVIVHSCPNCGKKQTMKNI